MRFSSAIARVDTRVGQGAMKTEKQVIANCTTFRRNIIDKIIQGMLNTCLGSYGVCILVPIKSDDVRREDGEVDDLKGCTRAREEQGCRAALRRLQ